MPKKILLSILAFVLWAPVFGTAYAEPVKTPESVYQAVQKNAEDAVQRGDNKESDFWIARYLGLSSADPASGHSLKDLEPIIKKKKLAPKAFVSGEWDGGFIDWFEKGLYPRWGIEDKKVRIKFRSMEIVESRLKDAYFATIVAYPELELWHVVDRGLVSRPLVLPMGSAKDRPTLFFGKIFKGSPSFEFNPLFLDTQKRSLHYVWKPEFYDLDADGTPELWIRFNIAWGNGFVQVLEIYRIQKGTDLVLLKRFQSGDDGFARRLVNGDVEVGSAFDSTKAASRLEYDSHRVETWNFQKGAFKKISEKTIPFVLKSAGWKDYFLD